jgi:hypothetical protein
MTVSGTKELMCIALVLRKRLFRRHISLIVCTTKARTYNTGPNEGGVMFVEEMKNLQNAEDSIVVKPHGVAPRTLK